MGRLTQALKFARCTIFGFVAAVFTAVGQSFGQNDTSEDFIKEDNDAMIMGMPPYDD